MNHFWVKPLEFDDGASQWPRLQNGSVVRELRVPPAFTDFDRGAGGATGLRSKLAPGVVLDFVRALAHYRDMITEENPPDSARPPRYEKEEKTPRDGRAARAQRTRRAVADALLHLLEEGELRPTSRMIAEKAGVSERTIFQHFEDLQTLFSVSASRLGDRILGNLDFMGADGPFEKRLSAYLDQLIYLHESVTPVRRASRLHESFSPVLDGYLRSWREALRRGIERVFAIELSEIPLTERPAVSEALALVATWSSWENMRGHSGFGLEQSRRVLEVAFRSMLRESQPVVDL
ncbi:MAG: hypothetical protein CL917_16755 [Deltaproteobacteria bacterium]|nr:hypothetical protein [Deltaproteobacteria bacterium]